MVELSKRLGIISEIVKQKPSLGKTAMMKFIYILQQVYKVPIGYDYEIYTYGPYSSGVMEDVQLAADFDAICMNAVCFPSGHLGYELKPSENTEKTLEREREFIDIYKSSIENTIKFFGNKNARELELSSTIIYIYANYTHNQWNNSVEEVSKNVQKIKPHFTLDTIEREYHELEDQGILKKAV